MLGVAEYVAEVCARANRSFACTKKKNTIRSDCLNYCDSQVSFSAPPFQARASSGRCGKERENGGARARLATIASYGGRRTAATADVMLVRARGEQHADDLDVAIIA